MTRPRLFVVGLVLVLASAAAALTMQLFPLLISLAGESASGEVITSLIGDDEIADAVVAEPAVSEELAESFTHAMRLRARWVLIAMFAGGLVLITVALARSRETDSPRSERSQRASLIMAFAAGVGILGAIAVVIVTGDDGRAGPEARTDPNWEGPPEPVLISELVASNGSTLADEDGDFPDWIELHNPSDDVVELTHYFLSDDDDEPARWQLPRLVLQADERVVVFASGKDRSEPGGELHTDFKVARGDEPVLLTAPDGETLVDRIGVVELPRDVSYGRDPADPDRLCYFAVPRPGEPNAPACYDDLDLGAPTLSVASGFYEQPFTLEISVDDPDATIIYTLDGSYPDLEHNPERTLVYDGRLFVDDLSDEPNTLATIDTTIPGDEVVGERLPPAPPELDEPIQKATVLRARTPWSAETVATYFVGDDLLREQLPVLSLVLDDEFLFDDTLGIYVAGETFQRQLIEADGEVSYGDAETNYRQRGRQWERPPPGEFHRAVVLEHCAPGGVCDFQQAVGLRVHGGASRSFAQKSLRLYARNDYGDRTFSYPFFGVDAPSEQRRLILRNSGQDRGVLTFTDAYLQGLMSHFETDTQAYQPAVLFINGRYWGIHNIRERYDRHYLEVTHGVDPDAVVFIDGGLRRDPDGQALVEYLVEHDPTDDATIRYVEERLDLDSFFDFVIGNVYVANSDWPGNNTRLWREPDGPHEIGEGVRDGRWRWSIIDLDSIARMVAGDPAHRDGIARNLFEDRMAPTDDESRRNGTPFVFHRLMEHPQVRARFLNRFADHLNTSFAPDRALAEMERIIGLIDDEIDLHHERWDLQPRQLWEERIELMRTFMTARPDIQREHLVDLFDLDGTATLTVARDPEQGVVHVNTVAIDTSTPGVDDPSRWEGVYFTGVPVTVEAVPVAGHEFVRWQGLVGPDAASPTVEIVLDDDVEISAVFAEE